MIKPNGLRTSGPRATELTQIPSDIVIHPSRLAMRLMSISDFIESRGSGTLRKNKNVGMNVASHALNERIAYEFGYAFEACPERFITWGEARSEGDCKPLTEAGWHIERYASMCLFPGDEIEAKYIIVEIDGSRREGVGLVVRKTSIPWLPAGYVVFAIITTFCPVRERFLKAQNPC